MKKNKEKKEQVIEEEVCKCHCEEQCECEKECIDNKEEGCQCDNKIKNLEEALLRSQAELINYKRRKDEEVGRMLKYAEEDIVRDFLPILDNFERAIKMDDDNLDDEVSKFLEGFKMVYTQIKNMLEKYEVKEIEAYGKEFDPTYHQAVMKDSVEDKESGIILEVFQKGYMYKDRVIRPSMVKVNE